MKTEYKTVLVVCIVSTIGFFFVATLFPLMSWWMNHVEHWLGLR